MKILNRIYNFLWSILNHIILAIRGIKYGKKVIIHGHLGLRKEGVIEIGNNVYISSGIDMNPLCARNNGYLCAEKDAKLIIGDNCAMSSPRIWAHDEIIIGNHVMMGGNVTIVDSDCHSLNYLHRRDIDVDMKNKVSKPVHIEDDAFIGMNTTILKGVTIGARAVIGAGSVVTSCLPADCIAAGNPCKVIKRKK